MAITYEEALSTLEAMFGSPWTRESLDLILRHHQGHMENTVEEVLRHGDNDPIVLIRQLQAGIDPAQSAMERDAEIARQLALEGQQSRRRHQPASTSAPPTNRLQGSNAESMNNRGSSTSVLPDDFLRIPGYPHPSRTSRLSDDTSVNGSEIDDATLARMLQDELFSQELAQNPDFAHLARGRSGTTSGSGMGAGGRKAQTVEEWFGQTRTRMMGGPPSDVGGARGKTANAYEHGNNNQGPNLLGKLSELGDNAKRRLQVLAAQFNAHQNKQAAAGRSSSGVGTSQSTPADPTLSFALSPNERRGLLDEGMDDDDMELAARKAL